MGHEMGHEMARLIAALSFSFGVRWRRKPTNDLESTLQYAPKLHYFGVESTERVFLRNLLDCGKPGMISLADHDSLQASIRIVL